MALRAVFFGSDDSAMLARVQALRKTIFVDRCGWQLRVEQDLEVDQFDGPHTIHLALQHEGALCGCFRAVRTDRPYLANTIFPELAAVFPYPARLDAWEVSRFGVLPGSRAVDLGRINYALMFAFAQWMRATSLVAVASLDHERFLRTLGIRTRRYGPPQVVGFSQGGRPLRAVAGEIAPALQEPAHLQRLLSSLHDVEIVHDASLFGPGRLSA